MKWDIRPDETENYAPTPEERKAIYKAAVVMLIILAAECVVIFKWML